MGGVSDDRGGAAREVGAAALAKVRRALARKAADMIRNDPDDAATALEIGLVDRAWLDNPGEAPLSSSAPTDILRRFLERSVERRPSKLSSFGLSAVQLLSSGGDGQAGADAKVLTIVFTDLEGFTAYTDANGDAAAIELITAHHDLAGPAVRQWKGRIVKHLGDGLLCTFPDTLLPGCGRPLDLLSDRCRHQLRLRRRAHG